MSEMIYGIHAVQALLERAPERFQEVFILKGREDKRLLPLIHALESQGVVIQLANRQYLDEKSDGAVHQGIIARVKPGRQYQENDLPDLIASLDQPFLLILDGVTDPHNLGACLRSADAAGVHAVIVPKDRSAQLNATAKKVACGAAESVPLIRVTNLARTMRMLQEENIWIVGTAGEADHTLYQSKMTGRLALATALQTVPEQNIDVTNNESALIIKLNDYGDLQINILFTSRQMIIETFICPVSSISNPDEFNTFLLRNQKMMPLSSVGISSVQQEEYYIVFGALSLKSSLEDILLEITSLVDNALDLAEITEEYSH